MVVEENEDVAETHKIFFFAYRFPCLCLRGNFRKGTARFSEREAKTLFSLWHDRACLPSHVSVGCVAKGPAPSQSTKCYKGELSSLSLCSPLLLEFVANRFNRADKIGLLQTNPLIWLFQRKLYTHLCENVAISLRGIFSAPPDWLSSIFFLF